jgi:putative ABC transport system permease protein
MDGLISDIKDTIRAYRRSPGHFYYIVAILGLGIGANTAIFSVVSAALFERIPWLESDRIVSIRGSNPADGIGDGPISTADYLEWRDHAGAFDLTTGFLFRYFNISGRDRPERVQGFEIDDRFLPMLGDEPLLGRNFTEREMEPGNDREAILTYRLWQNRFAGDPNVLGQNATIEGASYVIIGVLPSNFWMFKVLNHDVDLFVPLAVNRAGLSHGTYDINVYGRLKPGLTIKQAQSELTSVYLELEKRYPETNMGWSVSVVPIAEWNANIRSSLLLLLAAAGVVLMIACANIANLLVAVSRSRARELAIRQAVGANRLRLTRHLLTGNLILALTGGAVGLVISLFILEFLDKTIPYTTVRRVGHFHLDVRVLLFTLAASILTGLAFGLAPAAVSPRINLASGLKDASSAGGTAVAGRRARDLLVAAEIALTVVLLGSASMVIRGGLRLHLLYRGFDSSNLLIMQIWLPRARYPEKWQVSGFFDRALRRIRDLPGVQSAGLISFPPLDIISSDVEFTVPGRDSPPATARVRAAFEVVNPDYFRTLKIPLLEGRVFEDSDADETRGVVVLSKSLAQSVWPNQSPIGNRILLGFPQGRDLYWIPESRNLPLSVIGVVGDVNKEGLQGFRPGELYLPYRQNPSRFMHVVARTSANPSSLAPAVLDEIREMDNDEPAFEIRTMDDVISRSFSNSRIPSLLLGGFAALGLVVAGLGIYGLVSYTVNQQRAEIGIRMALGAARFHILKAIIGHTMFVATLGILVGLLGTMPAARVLEASVFGVTSLSKSTVVFVVLFVSSVTLVAACLPARKAATMDPVRALKCE